MSLLVALPFMEEFSKKTDAHESVYFFAIYLFKNESASDMSTP